MPSGRFSIAEPIIERGPPSAVVYDLSAPERVTITLPVGSTWSSGLHWHERHGLLVDLWVALSLFAIFRELDNVPVFVDVVHAFSARGFGFAEGTTGYILLRGMESLISHLILFIASWVAWAFGVAPVRKAFTPEEVRARWVSRRGTGDRKAI